LQLPFSVPGTISQFPSTSTSACSRTEPQGDNWHRTFIGQIIIPVPSQKPLKETPSTPKPWQICLIVSSSTTRLWRERHCSLYAGINLVSTAYQTIHNTTLFQ